MTGKLDLPANLEENSQFPFEEEPQKKETVVLLYSGGLDSTVLLYLARTMDFNVQALMIDYGQRHRRELTKAKMICDGLRVPSIQMKADLSFARSKLTTKEAKGLYKEVSEWHVPGRNTIFIGYAISLAETIGANRIWIGANFEDRINRFPDCAQEYLLKMSEACAIAASYPIILEAPLIGLRKETIKALAKMWQISMEDVHSGYEE